MVRLKTNRIKGSVDSIGGRLRKARADKGISLEEVHRVTKIHPKVLEALEEDRLEKTMGMTYVKAFLRNYAGYLGLDVKKIILDYSSKLTPQAEQKSLLEPRPFVLKKEEKRFNPMILAALAIIVWVLILSFATLRFIRSHRPFIKDRNIVASAPSPPAEAENIKKGLIPIPKSRIISLTIAAQKEVWLKLTQDGEVAFHGILPKNSREIWRADKEIKLTEIGRPEALNLNVNGKDIDFSGRRLGKNILITHEGIDLESGQKD